MLIFGCNSVLSPPALSQDVEVAFQKTIQIPFEAGVELLTKAKQYHSEDSIGIWVENKTNHSLLFKDQSLGLRVYKYDTHNKKWRLVLAPIKAADPYEITVTPGPRSTLPIVFLPAEWIRDIGPLRLVIIGVTDQGQPFAAYKDIEILD